MAVGIGIFTFKPFFVVRPPSVNTHCPQVGPSSPGRQLSEVCVLASGQFAVTFLSVELHGRACRSSLAFLNIQDPGMFVWGLCISVCVVNYIFPLFDALQDLNLYRSYPRPRSSLEAREETAWLHWYSNEYGDASDSGFWTLLLYVYVHFFFSSRTLFIIMLYIE